MSTGRNDPCPCGSGKKHKRCCLEKGDPAQIKRAKQLAVLCGIVVAISIVLAIAVSQKVALVCGALGLVTIGLWLWFTAEAPKSGSGSNPSAINFGR